MENRNFGQSVTGPLFHFFPTCSSMIQHGVPLMVQNPARTAPVWILPMGCNLQKKSSAVWDSHGLQFLLWYWLSVGCSGRISSNTVFHELQRNSCSGDGENYPPLNSVTLILFLSYFPHPSHSQMVHILFFTLYQRFYPKVKYSITELPCHNQGCLAQFE